MFFSIVIPTYEYKGKAPDLLNQLLSSIKFQTFNDYEIIISDHSVSDLVKNFIDTNWSELPIAYFKNERGRGNSSINMNEGIKIAKGKFIKIMHMDDWFCDNESLESIKLYIDKEPNKKWGGVGFNHFYENRGIVDRYYMPHINPNIRTLLGCPSVSFFINDKNDPIFFDENIIIINDSDLHIRLGKKYGDPIFVNKYCVTIRLSDDQVSNQVSEEKHLSEIKYYQNKNF